jgi:hypothetical protein
MVWYFWFRRMKPFLRFPGTALLFFGWFATRLARSIIKHYHFRSRARYVSIENEQNFVNFIALSGN